MKGKELIKNIPMSELFKICDLVSYKEGRVVSRTLAQNKFLSITLFAFPVGEGLSTHSAPGDAMVQILDGKARIIIDKTEVLAETGDVAVMPADIPHSLHADEPFKMILTVVKKACNEPKLKD